MANVGTYFIKNPSTKFVVRNTAPGNKRVRIFQYPIINGQSRDLLAIPGISEADIRHSLLKGDLMIKLKAGELIIEDTDIDLLQFNDDHKAFLTAHGVNAGLEVLTVDPVPDDGSNLTSTQHKMLRQLVHLADGVGGPMEGFASGAYRETLPVGNPFPTSIVWWESSAKIKKLVEKTLTRNDNQDPTIIAWKVYDTDGITILATMTDTITYSGPFETTRTRVLT